jgi:hypothetical protein
MMSFADAGLVSMDEPVGAQPDEGLLGGTFLSALTSLMGYGFPPCGTVPARFMSGELGSASTAKSSSTSWKTPRDPHVGFVFSACISASSFFASSAARSFSFSSAFMRVRAAASSSLAVSSELARLFINRPTCSPRARSQRAGEGSELRARALSPAP